VPDTNDRSNLDYETMELPELVAQNSQAVVKNLVSLFCALPNSMWVNSYFSFAYSFSFA